MRIIITVDHNDIIKSVNQIFKVQIVVLICFKLQIFKKISKRTCTLLVGPSTYSTGNLSKSVISNAYQGVNLVVPSRPFLWLHSYFDAYGFFLFFEEFIYLLICLCSFDGKKSRRIPHMKFFYVFLFIMESVTL